MFRAVFKSPNLKSINLKFLPLFTQQLGLPVLTVVLYLKRRVAPLPTAYETQVGKVRVNHFEYPVIKLWEYADEIAAGRWPELAPLLTTLVEKPDEATLARERELILREKDPQKRADLLACAVTIGTRYFDKEFLWRFFREEVEMLRGASFIEDWLEEQLEEGLQRGVQQGLQQGLHEARRMDMVRILRHRFGDVPLNLETQLGLLTADRLALLMDVALEAPDLVAFAEEVDHISSYQPVPA